MKREEAARVFTAWRDHAAFCEARARENGLPDYVQFSYITMPLQQADGSIRPLYITPELLDAVVAALTDEPTKLQAEIATLREIIADQEKAMVRLAMMLPGGSVTIPLIGKVT